MDERIDTVLSWFDLPDRSRYKAIVVYISTCTCHHLCIIDHSLWLHILMSQIILDIWEDQTQHW